MTQIAKLACFSFLAAALIGVPASGFAAESTNAPAGETPVPKKHGLPFHGKVVSVDPNAMTFTVGTMTISITSATKIVKDAKPAVFADIAVGEMISGSYRKDDAGKLTAASVRIGPKKNEAPAPAPPAAPAAASK